MEGRAGKIGKYEDLSNKKSIVAVNTSTGISVGSAEDKYFILLEEEAPKKKLPRSEYIQKIPLDGIYTTLCDYIL